MANKSQDLKENRKKAFIISPIGKENSVERLRFSGIYELVYAPVLEHLGFECEPIVDELRPGSIFSQIMDHLLNDDLVICDLTDNNPNVMYELAIRHIIRKPVVMIIERIKDDLKIPFDIQEDRIFDFPSNQAGLAKLKKTLPELINKAMLNETEINNPITRHINLKNVKISLEAPEKEPLKVLFNEVIKIQEMLLHQEIDRIDKKIFERFVEEIAKINIGSLSDNSPLLTAASLSSILDHKSKNLKISEPQYIFTFKATPEIYEKIKEDILSIPKTTLSMVTHADESKEGNYSILVSSIYLNSQAVDDITDEIFKTYGIKIYFSNPAQFRTMED